MVGAPLLAALPARKVTAPALSRSGDGEIAWAPPAASSLGIAMAAVGNLLVLGPHPGPEEPMLWTVELAPGMSFVTRNTRRLRALVRLERLERERLGRRPWRWVLGGDGYRRRLVDGHTGDAQHLEPG